MIPDDQLQRAMEAFLRNLPEGTVVHALSVVPRVGFADTEAGPVLALVLADAAEDFRRLEQVLNKGIHAYAEEPGLVAKHLRNGEQVNDKGPFSIKGVERPAPAQQESKDKPR